MFFAKFCCKFLALLAFLHKKCWKWLFRPAFGVHSTQTLVEIYNRPLTNCTFINITLMATKLVAHIFQFLTSCVPSTQLNSNLFYSFSINCRTQMAWNFSSFRLTSFYLFYLEKSLRLSGIFIFNWAKGASDSTGGCKLV